MSHDIKLYALSTCIHCKNTKAYLDECGDAYECVFVDKLEGDERKKIIDEVKKLNPSGVLPHHGHRPGRSSWASTRTASTRPLGK
jgi:Glutaredoxin and related proteins